MTLSPSDLRERVAAATGSDRELDADLWWRFDERSSEYYFNRGSMGLPQKRDHSKPMPVGLGRCAVRAMAPAYTASVDAALALIERVLPDAKVFLVNWPGGDLAWAARLTRDYQDFRAPTPALALISALLAAVCSDERSAAAHGTAREQNPNSKEP